VPATEPKAPKPDPNPLVRLRSLLHVEFDGGEYPDATAELLEAIADWLEWEGDKGGEMLGHPFADLLRQEVEDARRALSKPTAPDTT
jgi:hypothetical protein